MGGAVLICDLLSNGQVWTSEQGSGAPVLVPVECSAVVWRLPATAALLLAVWLRAPGPGWSSSWCMRTPRGALVSVGLASAGWHILGPGRAVAPGS
jgi:hypothetical protein